MSIEFDPAKDAAHRAKHGVPLALAEELDWAAALVWSTFVDRGNVRRIISMRRANRREVKHYVQSV